VQLGLRLVLDTLLTGLWRDDAGRVWVVDGSGVVRWCDDPWSPEAAWGQQELDLAFEGVVGGDDGVWAWGVRASDGASLVRRYDGRAWKPMPSPGFRVRAMASGESTWAVGDDGWVARYDRDRWTVLVGASDQRLLCAMVEGDGLICGSAEGHVFAGGVDGLASVATVPGACHAVARWRGELWVGAGPGGLFRGVSGALQVARSDRPCRSLDARGEHLVVGCDDVLCSSPDGTRFPAVGRGALPLS
jgi:hypothetical protein